MSLYLFLLVIGIIFALAYVFRRIELRKQVDKSAVPVPEDSDFLDLNEKFLAKAAGQAVVDLVRTFNQHDTIVLRSLLDSEEIPSYVVSNSMAQLYPGLSVQSFSDTIISVFEKDQAPAKDIIQDFISNATARDPGSAHPESVDLIHSINNGGNVRILPELLI